MGKALWITGLVDSIGHKWLVYETFEGMEHG